MLNGKEFRAWRIASKLSLREAAALANVGHTVIFRFERGMEIGASSYQKLVDLVGNEQSAEMSKQERIQWHIKQLEILTKGE